MGPQNILKLMLPCQQKINANQSKYSQQQKHYINIINDLRIITRTPLFCIVRVGLLFCYH